MLSIVRNVASLPMAVGWGKREWEKQSKKSGGLEGLACLGRSVRWCAPAPKRR